MLALLLQLLAAACVAYVGFAIGRRAERIQWLRRNAGRLLGRHL